MVNNSVFTLSTGSAEGFNKADRDINTAVKSGRSAISWTVSFQSQQTLFVVPVYQPSSCCRWVMLENVHLAPGWLMQLEKKLHSMQPHSSFRLFLTMEINPKVNDITSHVAHFICLNVELSVFLPQSLHKCFVCLSGACESASCWSYLCVRASSWCQGQHAQNIQQHPCGSHVQGNEHWTPQRSIKGLNQHY